MKMSKKAITVITIISVVGAAITVFYTFILFYTICNMDNLLAFGVSFVELGEYKDSDEFYDICFQDSTEYCKFYYDEDVLKRLENSDYYSKIEQSNKDRINRFVINFKEWLELTDFKDEFDFDLDKFDSNDYFYIDNYGFASYDVWCFDTESLTLYYFHNNI